jgi:cell division protein FtsI/penicillin-binding protein 2
MKVANNISQQDYERLTYILPKNSPMHPSVDDARYYPSGNLAWSVIGDVVMGDNNGQFSHEKIKTFTIKYQMGKSGIELAR